MQRKINQKASDTMYLHKQNQENSISALYSVNTLPTNMLVFFPAHLNTAQISEYLF